MITQNSSILTDFSILLTDIHIGEQIAVTTALSEEMCLH